MYYENHISISCEKKYVTDRGVKKIWDCCLYGELVGQIEFCDWHDQYKKPFTSTICVAGDSRRMSYAGTHDSLYSAKLALLKPAQKYLAEAQAMHNKSRVPIAFLPEENCQFYPTPSEVAGKLLSGINWKNIESVLEPSAGRGDLIDFAMRRHNAPVRKFGYRSELKDVDCIELDQNLRAMLIGKGYRVVHDDFLSYHTRKRYDLILMNPPFADGDAHLLHALELMQHGGQIACILNAETLRNPYTNRRKILLKELHRYGANIRYVSGGFRRAARKTDVEVALVNVTIPKGDTDTSIWDNMKKARKVYLESEGLNEIAPVNQVERLIREYDLLCEAGIQMMRVYNGVSDRILCSSKRDYSRPIIELVVDGDMTDKCNTSHINAFLRAARARYWRELFDLPELSQKMTSAMRDDYHSTIERMKEYEFSMFNIQQVIEQIMGQIVTGVEEAIIKCFDKLSAEHAYHSDVQNENIHYYNGWKTNKAHYVNAKCIIPTYGCFARGYKRDKYGRWKGTLEGLDVRGCFQILDDLEKALDYLDRGETSSTSLERMLQLAADGGSTTANCKYFTVTFYKKGTCHIKFHDQKILDRLNIYAGRQKAWLPPTYGKVRYEDMDEESKRVVDEFQGSEKYAEVLNHPEDYIIETKSAPLLLA